MPINPYGVLAGRAISGHPERDDAQSPHYQIRVEAGGTRFQVPVNVKSTEKDPTGIGAQLLYLANEQFAHPILAELRQLSPGFRTVPKQPAGLALDYIRGNLFDRLKMQRVPFNVPGEDNDLNDKLDHYVQKAVRTPGAVTYGWGQAFGAGSGVHDIHMNQGNAEKGKFGKDNGVYQDGGLMIHFPAEDQWVAIFLAFQTQAWHTNDETGHPDEHVPDPGPGDDPNPSEPDHRVRIVAAKVNPVGADPGKETVTLLNTTSEPVSLANWQIADRAKKKEPLSGILAPGETKVVTLRGTAQLGNQGGIITLLNDRGLKVHGVAYTAGQARREGETIVF